MTKSPRRGVALALICLLLLGLLPILANARPAGSDSLAFAIWLTVWQLLAALPLFFVERARHRSASVARLVRAKGSGRTALFALASGAMFGLSTYMYVIAAEKAGAVSMIIALQAYPLFAIAWETLFLGRRKSRLELVFTALLIAALVYLTTEGTFSIADLSWWSLFALGIPLLWSVAHILLKQLLDTTPITPSQVTVSRLVISGLCLLLLALASGEALPFALATDLAFQQAALLMGLAYYLELILWFYAVRHIEVSVASSVTVPAPAVTMLVAGLLLDEEIQLYQVLAMLFIALALYGLLLAGRRKLSQVRG